MSKRMSLIVLLVSSVLLAATGCERAPVTGKLQIVYSGNLRGAVAPCGCKVRKGGLARLATFTNRHHDPSASWLTVDAGSFVDRAAGGGCSDKCRFVFDSFAGLKYDVLALGKQEASIGYEALVGLIDTLKGSEIVCANLAHTDGGKLIAKPYAIRDYGSLKVGVIGLLSERDFPRGSTLIDSTRMQVTSSFEAAKKYLPALARKTDYVVLLTELPGEMIDSLTKSVPGIDLVISNGALRTGESLADMNGAKVTGTGSSGYNGHYMMVDFAAKSADGPKVTTFNEALTDIYDEPGPLFDRVASFDTNAKPAAPAATQPTTKVITSAHAG